MVQNKNKNMNMKAAASTPISDSDVEIPQDVIVEVPKAKKPRMKKDDEVTTKAKTKSEAKAKVKTVKDKLEEEEDEKKSDDKTTTNMNISDTNNGSDTSDNDSQEDKKKPGPSPIPKSMAKRVQTALKEKDSISSDVSIDKIQDILMTYRLMTIDDVANGVVVSEPNLFTYKRKAREERAHSNPKTGEPIVKPRHYVLVVEVKASTKDRFAEIPLTAKDNDALDEIAQKKSMKKAKDTKE